MIKATRARSQAIDDLVEAYLDWRQESAGLVRAYDGWASGEIDDTGMAFAAYQAALDREQQASAVYSDRVTRSVRGPHRAADAWAASGTRRWARSAPTVA